MCLEWQAFCYPILYATVSLPRAVHLDRFARTLDEQPDLGLSTVYFHYFGQVLPAEFMRRVFYRMPRLKHLLTQADVTQIEDADLDPTRPRPKLLTLEVRTDLSIPWRFPDTGRPAPAGRRWLTPSPPPCRSTRAFTTATVSTSMPASRAGPT